MTLGRLLVPVAVAVTGLVLAGPPAPAQDGKEEKKGGAIVSGKVTVDGQPVAKAKIGFHPEKGDGVAATTIEDGVYLARNVPVGKLKVTIDGDRVPKDFADPKTTPLVVE